MFGIVPLCDTLVFSAAHIMCPAGGLSELRSDVVHPIALAEDDENEEFDDDEYEDEDEDEDEEEDEEYDEEDEE
jgi:hypothetical protein